MSLLEHIPIVEVGSRYLAELAEVVRQPDHTVRVALVNESAMRFYVVDIEEGQPPELYDADIKAELAALYGEATPIKVETATECHVAEIYSLLHRDGNL